jgi:hypothetical protein
MEYKRESGTTKGPDSAKSGGLKSNPQRGLYSVSPTLLSSVGLVLIVLTYLALATAYAVGTPRWQVPDEPAHYNYVAELARTGQLPVLEPGDYPHQYLEEIKAAHFPADMPVDSIRYEAWQPPLYYTLAAIVFKLTAFLSDTRQFLALRFLSVALGAMLLLVADRIVHAVFPADGWLALSTVAFVAFLPMHLTMIAAVNNDTTAELVLALIVLVALQRLNGRIGDRRYALLGGLLLGLALLTKTTIYAPAAATLIGAEVGRWWLARQHNASHVLPLLSLFLLAFLLSSWWFVRNALTYGGLDIFGWGRHDQVVVGQPRTAEWIAQFGLWWVVQQFVVTSFKSFWGVFGWMGVPMPPRFYWLLALISAAGSLGFGLWLVRVVRGRRNVGGHGELALSEAKWLPPRTWLALLLLALPPLFALAAHIWYNLSFVQHQGRYLFPGLISAALFFNLGLRELFGRRLAPLFFGLGYAGLVGLAGYSLIRFIIPNLV